MMLPIFSIWFVIVGFLFGFGWLSVRTGWTPVEAMCLAIGGAVIVMAVDRLEQKTRRASGEAGW